MEYDAVPPLTSALSLVSEDDGLGELQAATESIITAAATTKAASLCLQLRM
jgi:hypothetical protein